MEDNLVYILLRSIPYSHTMETHDRRTRPRSPRFAGWSSDALSLFHRCSWYCSYGPTSKNAAWVVQKEEHIHIGVLRSYRLTSPSKQALRVVIFCLVTLADASGERETLLAPRPSCCGGAARAIPSGGSRRAHVAEGAPCALARSPGPRRDPAAPHV